MKTTTTFFALALTAISITLFAQANTGKFNPRLPHPKPASYIPLYDSIYTWSSDTAGLGWDVHANQKSVNYTYNAHGNVLTETTETNPSNYGWNKDNMFISTYDVHNNQLSDSDKYWNGVAWANFYLSIYTYDANNNRLSDTFQTWNSSAWANTDLSIYTYDAHNNLLSDTDYYGNGSGWSYTSLTSYTYDARNNMLSDTFKTWNSSAWVNYSLNIYTYDIHNNMLSQTYQTWSGSAWVNIYLNAYIYNAGNNVIRDTAYNWSGVWVINYLTTYTYDVNYNLLAELTKSWNGTAWVNSGLNTYSYDADNIQLSNTTRQYSSGGPQFYGDSIYYYFHHELQGIQQLSAGSNQLSVYPNPSNGMFNVSITNYKLRITDVEVYNVLGEKIFTSTLPSPKGEGVSVSYPINISSQPGGVYFYRVVAEDGSLVGEGKLVVQK
jgi:hypothetical protein